MYPIPCQYPVPMGLVWLEETHAPTPSVRSCAHMQPHEEGFGRNDKFPVSFSQQLQRLLSSEITSCYSDIGFAVHVGIDHPSSVGRRVCVCVCVWWGGEESETRE